MNKTLRTLIIIFVVLIGAVALVGTGFAFGRSAWGMGGFYSSELMGGSGSGYGMMGGSRSGYGMMGSGMMGGYDNVEDVDPLSVEETREAVEAYLTSFDDNELIIEEIMVFNNNAYAIVVEEDTGIGAFELLIDSVTKAVYPEYGPNMMWNLKYGMMSGFGGYGMMGPGMMMNNSGSGDMMGGFDSNNADTAEVSAELSVSPQEALETAQLYLDQYFPGAKVTDDVTAFYGYYTLDFENDGEIVGMLSVNGFTRQVFPHTWHGDFIEMVETGHE
jgi:hypothetical protein